MVQREEGIGLLLNNILYSIEEILQERAVGEDRERHGEDLRDAENRVLRRKSQGKNERASIVRQNLTLYGL